MSTDAEKAKALDESFGKAIQDVEARLARFALQSVARKQADSVQIGLFLDAVRTDLYSAFRDAFGRDWNPPPGD